MNQNINIHFILVRFTIASLTPSRSPSLAQSLFFFSHSPLQHIHLVLFRLVKFFFRYRSIRVQIHLPNVLVVSSFVARSCVCVCVCVCTWDDSVIRVI